VYVHKVLQGPILQRMSDRNEALMRIVLRTMLEKMISLKAKMGNHWHRRGLWRQARLTARNKLMSVSLLSWSEQTKLVRIDGPRPTWSPCAVCLRAREPSQHALGKKAFGPTPQSHFLNHVLRFRV